MSTDLEYRRSPRQDYWEAKRRLEGLVTHVDVRFDARLRPYLEVSVTNRLEQFYAAGVLEDLERVELQRAAQD